MRIELSRGRWVEGSVVLLSRRVEKNIKYKTELFKTQYVVLNNKSVNDLNALEKFIDCQETSKFPDNSLNCLEILDKIRNPIQSVKFI